ncbi:phage head-tail connector protein [Paenibacillus sp. FSL R7-0340]|uniref:phage head-tail connector protein n=1 Tax=Paenibacillus sp. FSL R7-0340 TaxID=2921684 RepID=UPI0030FAFCDC
MEPSRREALLTKLKILLGIPVTDTSKDVQLGFSLDFTIDGIQNYCNISDIPTQLENTVLQIAEDYYRTKYSEEFAKAAPVVTSVKRGDVTTAFGPTKAAVSAGSGTAFVRNYAVQLNAFRKLRW